MKFERRAGILLHPTSLPGKYGIGDLGPEAYKFVDFLHDAGQSLWQTFPLGPTGYGDSPYQCFSAFAGNPLLISFELLIENNLLTKDDLNELNNFNPNIIDYGRVIEYKMGLLKKAFKTLSSHANLIKKIEQFSEENAEWLDDYALFMAAKEYHGGIEWKNWEPDIAFRQNNFEAKWLPILNEKINFQKFIQFLFFDQWNKIKDYANNKKIKIIGDVPIFVAYDSADLWANRNLFSVDDVGNLLTVAGVPPDYFSPTGQLWGNPLYKWDEMAKNNYAWWIKRFKQIFKMVDIVRIDHFRGFEAYFEIPGNAKTAEKGKWVKAPGKELFDVLMNELGEVPIIAEDLGVITEEVKNLRDRYNFPGMKILQFAFGDDGDKNFLPHNYTNNCVVYSGSHDNDTTKGFFEAEKLKDSGIYEWAQNYMNYYGDDMRNAVIKTAYSSVANTVIIPLQDMLNLGTEARMNFPGKPGGNWTWRFTWDQVYDGLTEVYNSMSQMYGRTNNNRGE